MEHTKWKLPPETHTMEITSGTIHHGSYLMERTQWTLPH